jgi:hypothetical protein
LTLADLDGISAPQPGSALPIPRCQLPRIEPGIAQRARQLACVLPPRSTQGHAGFLVACSGQGDRSPSAMQLATMPCPPSSSARVSACHDDRGQRLQRIGRTAKDPVKCPDGLDRGAGFSCCYPG